MYGLEKPNRAVRADDARTLCFQGFVAEFDTFTFGILGVDFWTQFVL